MGASERTVDGFRFLPPSLAAWIKQSVPEHDFEGVIPWTPLNKPLNRATFSFITSAGVSLKTDRPFDMERERREPTWGDRSYRIIPKTAGAEDIDVRHLHINTQYILDDINVMLPLDRMKELEAEGVIGSFAPSAYSFYGFQWSGDEFLSEAIQPMAEHMKTEGVDAVVLTPA